MVEGAWGKFGVTSLLQQPVSDSTITPSSNTGGQECWKDKTVVGTKLWTVCENVTKILGLLDRLKLYR